MILQVIVIQTSGKKFPGRTVYLGLPVVAFCFI